MIGTHTELFTRWQISHLVGVSDGVLSFWIKNGLLVPLEGGAGRGSHRKFARIQVSFAAILERLQRFGLNIGALRSFASILQRGVELCGGTNLHPASLTTAAHLAERLAAFRGGEVVEVRKSSGSPSRQDGVERGPAQSGEEIIADLPGNPGFDPEEEIASFAKTLVESDRQPIDLYEVVYSATVGIDLGEVAWLLWQDEAGWRVAEQSSDYSGFSGEPPVDTAIFLAVEKVVRRVWGFDLDERKRRFRAAYLADLMARDPSRFERWMATDAIAEDEKELVRLFAAEKP